MGEKWLQIKQRVELHIETAKGILNLSTHVEHITTEGEIIVAAPFYQGQLYPFLAKEKIELYSVIEGIGVISCDVVVAKRLKNGNIILLLLERISEIRKIQRRKHYRLPTLLEAEVEIQDRQKFDKFQVVAKDISAGGIKCITPKPLYHQEHVRLKVDLNGDALLLHSSVLESIALTPEDIRFETRFEFDHLELNQERIIVAYIFEEQRKRRRRG